MKVQHRHRRSLLPLALLATAATLAAPFLILFAWMAEQEVLGTHAVSWMCHSINIDEPLDWLYGQLFERG